MSPRALLNLQNLKQVARHLHSIWVLLPERSQEEEEEVEEEKEEAEKGCEGSGARQPDLLGADNVAELGLDLQEMPLELQAIALRGERQGLTSPTPTASLPPLVTPTLHPLYVVLPHPAPAIEPPPPTLTPHTPWRGENPPKSCSPSPPGSP